MFQKLRPIEKTKPQKEADSFEGGLCVGAERQGSVLETTPKPPGEQQGKNKQGKFNCKTLLI